jgi:hypothetical protein
MAGEASLVGFGGLEFGGIADIGRGQGFGAGAKGCKFG